MFNLPSVEFEATVLDMIGRPVLALKKETFSGNRKIMIPMQSFENGIYILRIELNNTDIALRIVKE
jgi:hypothetical protein